MDSETKTQIIDTICGLFDQMPFNQLLGLKVHELNPEHAEVHFEWQDAFIGNPVQKILHGGVTASVLDTVGGLVAIAHEVNKMETSSPEALSERLGKIGTIDLRTDYLRPGRGEKFVATARVIRSGNKVCVCRMELHNEQDVHIAFGTGTYLLG